jgi:2-iminobutanoate/2-iminopropanoate deaminase
MAMFDYKGIKYCKTGFMKFKHQFLLNEKKQCRIDFFLQKRRNCILDFKLNKIYKKMKKLVVLYALCLSVLNPLLSQDLKYITVVEGLKKSASPFSFAVWAGDFCYLAGQLGTNPETEKISEDFKEESHQVMRNLQAVLKSQGLDFKDVVKTTVYVTDVKDFAAMNEVYRSYFPEGNFPARETVQVAALVRGARIEISMTAYKKVKKMAAKKKGK